MGWQFQWCATGTRSLLLLHQLRLQRQKHPGERRSDIGEVKILLKNLVPFYR